jgi:O-antigen/teichoic acid export membrane protein
MERGLSRNAALSMMQALVVMACVFLSYRVLIAQEGIAALGLWSLLMVFAGVVGTFDISGVSALARFVARHDVEFPQFERAALLHTVLLTGMAINSAMLAVLILLTPWALPLLVDPTEFGEARTLVIWAAALMLINPLALGITTSIDGLMRADIRAILVSLAAVAGLIVSWLAIPQIGIAGLPLGLLIQQGIVIAGGWVVLRRTIARLGWLPWRWEATIFRATTSYALRLNFVGALGLLLEPLARYCINSAGGTTALGLYELAARLAIQLRSLVISASMPLVPVFAASAEANSPASIAMLDRAQRLISLAALIVALLSGVGAPVLSLVILGHVSAELLAMNALLALGWSMNVLGVAWYLLAQSQGKLRWNILAHAAIGLAIVTTALLAGEGSALTIVAGVAAGLTVSAAITIIGNARQFALGVALRGQALGLGIAVLLIIGVCAVAFVLAIRIA